jgi:hypothetical protein
LPSRSWRRSYANAKQGYQQRGLESEYRRCIERYLGTGCQCGLGRCGVGAERGNRRCKEILKRKETVSVDVAVPMRRQSLLREGKEGLTCVVFTQLGNSGVNTTSSSLRPGQRCRVASHHTQRHQVMGCCYLVVRIGLGLGGLHRLCCLRHAIAITARNLGPCPLRPLEVVVTPCA